MKKHALFISALIVCAAVYSGLVPLRAQLEKKNAFTSILSAELTGKNSEMALCGKIASSPVKTSDGKNYKFSLEVSSAKTGSIESSARGKCTVLFPAADFEAFLPGKLYSLSKSHVLLDAGISARLTGKFSKSRKTGAAYFIATRAAYAGDSSGLAFFRAQSRLALKRIVYAWHEAGGLFLALISGSTEYIEDGLGELFRNAGLSHVLALSGMHLSIFSGFFGSVTKRGGKKFSSILSFAAVVIFVWFAGFSPSLRRAFIGFVVGLSVRYSGKETSQLNVLSFTFFLHIFVAAEEMFTVSFMLSYAALAGILLFSEFFRFLFTATLARFFPPIPALESDLAASCGAVLATSPITLAVFGTVSPIGIIATPLISPLTTIFLITGFSCFLLALVFPPLIMPFGFVMERLYALIVFGVKLFN
ncbi:MAG: ComEC/Rec2 family competence protein [Treponemataceae bacterium]|nr:MAG: ComEC/Rec2 family competence protein [Treponemataceae bacterium]